MRLAIGFITYNNLTAKYLPYFWPSLNEALLAWGGEYKIFIADNSEKAQNANSVFFQNIKEKTEFIWSEKNIGFARAYNNLINKALLEEYDYFLVINPDVILEKESITKLVKELEIDPLLASVCPKILRLEIAEEKPLITRTKIIDSCGIGLKPGLSFFDIGQGEEDSGQYNKNSPHFIGPSGACGLFKIEGLIKASYFNENKKLAFFDENMFMYKEDCDLAYRFFRLNLKSKYIPGAIIYHDRTVADKKSGFWQKMLQRRSKSEKTREWSLVNQNIIFLKHWSQENWQNRIFIIFHALALFVYTLFFESNLVKNYLILAKNINRIKIAKRRG